VPITKTSSRDQGPTGVARRRQRISDAETEQRMLQTALSLVESQGLTVSLDHVSLENVITHADVSRSSAYRRWPYKDLFLADLLVAVARDTDLTVEPPGLIDELTALIASRDLSDAQARRDLLVEALRLSSGSEFERIWGSPRWRTYVALSATVPGLPLGPIRDAAAAAVLDAEARFVARRARVYRNLAAMIGYRVTGGIDADIGYELMSSTSGAVMTGYVVKALVDQALATATQRLAPFGTTQTADWTVPMYGLTAVFVAFLEPDPDADWSPGAIEQRRQLWAVTAQALYEM
jgi:AcrR family transcriptional regulator